MTPKPYDLTTYGGQRVDWLTRAALESVASRLARPLVIAQGSYNAGGVAASAGTHDGGGVVDVIPRDKAREVFELRRAGFAAWYRAELWRDGVQVWGPHIHAVLIGNRKLSAGAAVQVREYLAGFDGLAGDGRDVGPREFIAHRFTWRMGAGRISRARDLLERAEAQLATGVRGYPRVSNARRDLRDALNNLPITEKGQKK